MNAAPAADGLQPTPLIVAIVGTDHHPFNRMSDWLDRWLVDPSATARCIVQYGHSRPPRVAEGRARLSYQETQTLIGQAHAVVCHGGPATIMDCRRARLTPLVLPRKRALGEHVDDHQVLFTRRLADAGIIRLIDDEAALHRALSEEIMKSRAETRLAAASEGGREAVQAIGELIVGMGPRRRLLRRKSMV